VPQQGLVGDLHQLLAVAPVPTGDQQALVGEPAGDGLTGRAQLGERRPAAKIRARISHLDQDGEHAGDRLALVRFQAGIYALGADDDRLLQAAHGAVGIQRQGSAVAGPFGPELLQGELQQG
jgi:hypothetical protein